MADKKISQLTAATTPLAGTEVLPIVQSGSTVKVASNDLTVKNVRSNATTGILQVAGPDAGSTRVMTVPNANFTAARTDAAQTFTGDQTFGTVLATTFDTNVAAAGVTLSGVTLSADGTDTNININITPKGTGEVAMAKVNIDGGTIDGTAIGGASAAAGSFTTLGASGDVSLNGGNFVFNDAGAVKTFRVETGTYASAVDVQAGSIGFGKAPSYRVDIAAGSGAQFRWSNTADSDRGWSVTTTTGVGVQFGTTSGVYPLIFAVDNNEAGRFDTSSNYKIKTGNLAFEGAGKGIIFEGNSSVIWRTGSGTPEGNLTAPVGSLYTRTDGGANTTLYVKESGAGNTGWVAK